RSSVLTSGSAGVQSSPGPVDLLSSHTSFGPAGVLRGLLVPESPREVLGLACLSGCSFSISPNGASGSVTVSPGCTDVALRASIADCQMARYFRTVRGLPSPRRLRLAN